MSGGATPIVSRAIAGWLRRGARCAAALALAVAALAPGAARAHAVGISRGEYRAEGDAIAATLLFARTELVAALPEIDRDGDGSLSAAEIDAARGALLAWLARGASARSAAGECRPRLDAAAATEQDGVELRAAFRCAAPVESFRVRLDLLGGLSLGHRQLATASVGDRVARAVLYAAQPELVVGDAPVASGGADLGAAGRGAAPAETGGPAGAAIAEGASRSAGAGGLLRSSFALGFRAALLDPTTALWVSLALLAGDRSRWLGREVLAFALGQAVALPVSALGGWRAPGWALPTSLALAACALALATVAPARAGREPAARARRTRPQRRAARGRAVAAFALGGLDGCALALRLRLGSGSTSTAAGLPLALAACSAAAALALLAALAISVALGAALGRRAASPARGVLAARTALALLGSLGLGAR